MKILQPLFTIALVTTWMFASTAQASDSESSGESPKFGVGYKIGNGVGFTGIDVLLSPVPNLTLDLQVSWMPVFERGIAVVPQLQYSLRATGSSPYVGAGTVLVSIKDGNTKASGYGFVANIGYEWKWESGFGIQLGGGVGFVQEITATNGTETVSIGGQVNPNLELGFRFRF